MVIVSIVSLFVFIHGVRGICKSQEISKSEPNYTVDPNINGFCRTPIFGYPWMYMCTDESSVTLEIWAYNLQNIENMIDYYYWVIPGNEQVNSTNRPVRGISFDPLTRQITVENISKPFYGQYTLVVYLKQTVTLDFGYGFNRTSNVIYMKDFLNLHNRPYKTSHIDEYRMSWIVSMSVSIGFFAIFSAAYAVNRFKYAEDESGTPIVKFGRTFNILNPNNSKKQEKENIEMS